MGEQERLHICNVCHTSWIVGLDFFKEVDLYFLIVGHTHEDIDHKFSVFSNILKKKDIDTLNEMLQLVKKGPHIQKRL